MVFRVYRTSAIYQVFDHDSVPAAQQRPLRWLQTISGGALTRRSPS